MSNAETVRTCVRCHGKKVKCSGFPGCRNCREASVDCAPYTRPKKNDTIRALKQLEKRVQWLEGEISGELNVECRSLSTGTSLRTLIREASSRTTHPLSPEHVNERLPQAGIVADTTPEESRSVSDVEEALKGIDAPETSLLALNATGDLKFLGPSSGAFFATYATALVRLSSRVHTAPAIAQRQHAYPRVGGAQVPLDDPQADATLSSAEVDLLCQSYEMWVHPIFPLLNLAEMREDMERCRMFQVATAEQIMRDTQRRHDMTMFYLIMALGSANRENTVKQLRNLGSGNTHLGDPTPPSFTFLYTMALRYFDLGSGDLQPNSAVLRIILLICIYSSYGPIGASQWQLTGLAMRMAVEIGLHYEVRSLAASDKEKDERSRIFWTAYAIEVSLAYNLGRPPSISQEHITVGLPALSPGTMLGVHHIKHRQIQGKIVSLVYCGASRADPKPQQERQCLIDGLQVELDQWRTSLPALFSTTACSSYPESYWHRLYHGTSFVLHRSSPLVPYPSYGSVERCIRSAGAYIENMTEVLRTSNVPLSWMLVQGVLFAGLTMAITALTCCARVSKHTGWHLFLVDFPSWARKCSVCLAIMNERWGEDLLPELERQFELLAENTLQVISCSVSSATLHPGHDVRNDQAASGLGTNAADDTGRQRILELGPIQPNTDPSILDFNMMETWESMDLFREFLGIDGAQTFWDLNPPDVDFNGTNEFIDFGQGADQAAFNGTGSSL